MSVKNRNSIVTDGLVFCVDAGNEDSYPGSGNSAYDLVNRTTLPLVAQASHSTDNGGTFVFDGTDDYIGGVDLGITFSDITFSCWVKRNGSQTDYTGLLISRPNVSGIGIMQTGRIWPMWNGGIYSHNSNLFIPDGQWAMVTVTFGSGTVNFYMNTTSSTPSTGTSTTYSGTTTLGDLKIGIDEHNAARSINGNIACASIYGRALSASEITQNYNALKNRFI
tara:strand:- start:36 stop:701 length:666 start_codon:yes stop_codon:yes gene_type:complete